MSSLSIQTSHYAPKAREHPTSPVDRPIASPRTASAPGPHPNPSLRLDAGLGMVVLEFRDDTGTVKNTIPSQRILDSYRAQAPSTDRSSATSRNTA